MAQMNKWGRLEASVEQQPTDRVPWALWRHFYYRETNAGDLVKVTPRAQYHAEAWGCRYRYSGQPDVKPVAENLIIKTAGDWERIDVRPPSTPALDEQLKALTEIRRGLRGEVPFVETV